MVRDHRARPRSDLDEAGISDDVAEVTARRIADPEQVAKSRMLPMWFLPVLLGPHDRRRGMGQGARLREVLDQGEDVRDEIRSHARRELQGLIFRETGTLLPDDYMAKVPVEEVEESEPAGAVPTSSVLELLGGPGDGCRFTVAGPPPMRYLRPITPPLSALRDPEPPPGAALRHGVRAGHG